LYAPKDIYDTYIKYNKNQELFIKRIEKSNDSTITKDIIEELVFNKYKRSIDRMKLNLRMNMEDTESEESEESEDSDYVEGEIEIILTLSTANDKNEVILTIEKLLNMAITDKERIVKITGEKENIKTAKEKIMKYVK
jgi:hypothetical protein